MAEPIVRVTGDGSHTLFHPESGECYHSSKGALTESEYVFVQAGDLHNKLDTAARKNQVLAVLEMGLGTGLNYLLAARAALQAGTQLDYHALENAPLSANTFHALSYGKLLDTASLADELADVLGSLQQRASHEAHQFDTAAGSLTVHLGDACTMPLATARYSLCFYDAFSPSSAPALWETGQLQRIHDSMAPGGTWVSYCAQGAVRRSLVACGFQVERLTGPPGKREMLRATRR